MKRIMLYTVCVMSVSVGLIYQTPLRAAIPMIQIAVQIDGGAPETFVLPPTATIEHLKEAVVKKYPQLAETYTMRVVSNGSQIDGNQQVGQVKKGVVLQVEQPVK